jgi:hypothetical protein
VSEVEKMIKKGSKMVEKGSKVAKKGSKTVILTCHAREKGSKKGQVGKNSTKKPPAKTPL